MGKQLADRLGLPNRGGLILRDQSAAFEPFPPLSSIPAKIRERLGIKKGTRLHVEERDGEVILRPLNREYFQKMNGILKGGDLVKALEKSRAEDRRREEEKIERRKGSR